MSEADLLPPSDGQDVTSCEREPIQAPGSIQCHGALLVADARDLRVTHASANLGRDVLDQSLADLLGRDTMAELDASLRDGLVNFGGICQGVMPSADRTASEVVAHHYEGRIYVELEPVMPQDERPEELITRAQILIHALRREHTRQELCETAVEGLRTLTGFDRVMAYRFDSEANGEVVAEARDITLEPFLGLRYPASDIPVQARRLYLQQRIRAIPDVNYVPVPMLVADRLAGPAPLDMSFCHLRGISPLHLQYLGNMGVGATLAISLVCEDLLWGMLICHHRRARRISARTRANCDLIGQIMSLLIDAKGKAEFLGERMIRQSIMDGIGERMLTAPSVTAALLEDPQAVLRLVRADGAVIQLGGKVELIGRLPEPAQALAVASTMLARAGSEVCATKALGNLQPRFASLAVEASGVLSLPILHGPGHGITWFRGEVAQTVTWAGNPDKLMEQDGDHLSPRRSFAAWRRQVAGQSNAWDDVDLDVARDLRRLVTSATLRHLETQAHLANLRHYDALTNLPNRRLLNERLAARASDRQAGDAVMIFLDLDRFKTVNDSLGHAAGDDLLLQVASRLVEHVPGKHLIARIGGDEFVVLCEDTGFDEAQRIAQEIVFAFRTPFQLAGKPYRLTASVGLAAAGSHGSEDMMRSADIAMYAAKRGGGNRAITFDNRLYEASFSRLEIEQELYEALERGDFELHYQPIIRVGSGEIISLEALIRWRSPKRGLIPPSEFISFAEETGLIVPIGAWALRQALQQVRDWRERFDPSLTVSVNVSGKQTARPEFPAEVAAALDEVGLPSGALIIEVTESILAQNAAVSHLEAVRVTGVRVAVDDFGTGYSSLAYLQRLPVDELKIDRLFLDAVGLDSRATGLMEIVIQLGRLLGLEVVAEGVETEQQARELGRLGCGSAQGYWISRPLPAHLMTPLLGTTLGVVTGPNLPRAA